MCTGGGVRQARGDRGRSEGGEIELGRDVAFSVVPGEVRALDVLQEPEEAQASRRDRYVTGVTLIHKIKKIPSLMASHLIIQRNVRSRLIKDVKKYRPPLFMRISIAFGITLSVFRLNMF